MLVWDLFFITGIRSLILFTCIGRFLFLTKGMFTFKFCLAPCFCPAFVAGLLPRLFEFNLSFWNSGSTVKEKCLKVFRTVFVPILPGLMLVSERF